MPHDLKDVGSSFERGRLQHSQVIEAALLNVGINSKIDEDLEYSAQVMRRAVQHLKMYERSVDFHHIADQEKMEAMLTLNTMYALQAKVARQEAEKERQHRTEVAHRQGERNN